MLFHRRSAFPLENLSIHLPPRVPIRVTTTPQSRIPIMTSFVTSLCAICLIACLTPATSTTSLHDDQATEYITTVTGRIIPRELVVSRLQSSKSPTRFESLDHHVYELTSDQRLSSPIHTIHTSKFTHVEEASTANPHTRHFVNGIPLKSFTPSARVKSGDGYVALHVGQSDQLISISGHGVELTPLHPHHPEIFIAVRRMPSPSSPSSAQPKCADEKMTRKVCSDLGQRKPLTGRKATNPLKGSCAQGKLHYVEIGVAFDNSLCRFHGYNERTTISAIHAMFMAASRPFILDTCLRLALVHVDGHCRDPNDPYQSYTELVSMFLVRSFIAEWQKPERVAVKRDLLYLITGFNDGTTTLGFAFPGTWGGICDPMRGFGWVEGIIPGVFAFNLARNLGGNLTDTGLLNPFYTPGAVPRLSPESRKQLTTFIDENPFASCITTDVPKSTVTPITLKVPPKNTLPEYGTCSVSRRKSNVLDCSKKRHKVGMIQSSTAGSLMVLSYQQFGKFFLVVRGTKPNVVIENFRGLQNMNASFTKFTVPLMDDFEPTKLVKITRDDENLRWPRPTLTCCDHLLYIYTHVKWCRTMNSTGMKKCATAFRRFSRKVECKAPCFGRPTGRVIPMSSDRQCPICKAPRSKRKGHIY